MHTTEHVIAVEQVLNIAAVLCMGVSSRSQNHLALPTHYFAAIPRDMLRLVISCMEDCIVDGRIGTRKTYTVCGVKHRFGPDPAIVIVTPCGWRQVYYKYGLRHRIDGPADIDFSRSALDLQSHMARYWLTCGNYTNSDAPSCVINYFGRAPYAVTSWPDHHTEISYPGDRLWSIVGISEDEVALFFTRDF